MRISQTRDQKIKAGLHAVQAALIFIAACLALGVMTKTGGIGGETGFYFALCFLSVPALIYQVMVPMWTRAWRFANVYAYASIDVLYAILWFAASIAVAVWNSDGESKGAKSQTGKSPSPSCDTFAFGSATKCQVSKASVGIGILIFLVFGITAGLSIRAIFIYRRTGIMPNGNSRTHGKVDFSAEDPNKDAWSANVDELEHGHGNGHDTPPSNDDRLAYGQETADDQLGLLNTGHHQRTESQDEDGMAHPGRPYSYASETTAPPAYNDESAPSALSPVSRMSATSGLNPPSLVGYEPHGGGAPGRVDFPQGNYNSAGV